MEEEEYERKYVNLRILKSIQDYLKSEKDSPTAVYPIRVPDDLRKRGQTDSPNFHVGSKIWSEKVYHSEFGSSQSLEDFIELVKKRNRE